MYSIEKNLTRLYNDQPTFFLDSKDQMDLKGKLKGLKYKVYLPYKESEKCIFYTKKIPEVILYEIKCKNNIRHQDILGSMFSLNISPEMFGDIILVNNKYYIYIIKLFQNYFESNLKKIGNFPIELEICDFNLLENYKHSYEEIEIISSSERIDSVISKIINCNRDSIKNKIKDKEILLNYSLLKNNSYILKKDDIFSIRKYGKYRYFGIINNTKKDNYIIKCYKYL